MLFLIRNFGNDTKCESFAALKSGLQKYRGKSVSIDDQRPGGSLHFVNVKVNGDIFESYGEKAAFNVDKLQSIQQDHIQ